MEDISQAPIKDIEISRINPAAYNPRRLLRPGDKEYEDIKASLIQWGLVQPLVWNQQSGTLVGGHQRLNVIRRERPEQTKVRCAVIDVDEATEKALNLALNKIGEGLWSQTKLKALIEELDSKQKIDIQGLGFSEDEIQELLKRPTGSKPKRDPNDAPAPPTKPLTKHGDVYHLMGPDGDPQHRIRCGDSTDAAAIDDLMGDQLAHAIITDPPYGVSYVSKSQTGKMARNEIKNDELRGPVLQKLLAEAFQVARDYSHKDAPIYCFYASRCHIEFEHALREAEWEVRQQLIWAKRMALGRSNYHWAHEPILYAAKVGQGTRYLGDRAQTTLLLDSMEPIETLKSWKKAELLKMLEEMIDGSTLWHQAQDPPSTYIHPTQKPVELIGKAIRHSTLPKQNIYDPFLGSGSALIAAEIEGRSCYGQELEPGHVDAIVHRYVETFEEVLVYRNGKELNPTTLQEVS